MTSKETEKPKATESFQTCGSCSCNHGHHNHEKGTGTGHGYHSETIADDAEIGKLASSKPRKKQKRPQI